MNRVDLAILTASLLLVGTLYVQLFTPHTAGSYALIGTGGDHVQRYSLGKEQLIHVDGPLGKTTLEIKDNRIRFIDSPCPNKICIHSGWHNAAGDFAACLPNHVTLQIETDKKLYDSMSY